MTVLERPLQAEVIADLEAPPRRATGRVVALVGAGFLLLYLVLALLRFRYPYELEWMEGGVVDHVGRILDGHGLYGAPSIRFTPYIYSPLYYYVSAGVAWFTGLGFAPLRAVSIVSSIAAFGGVAALVREETRHRWAPLAAAGLFAACFRLGGAWFDLARVDSLFLALLFWGLVLARRASSSWQRFAVAGGVFTLAFLTKQSALLPAVAVLPWSLRAGRRCAIAYGTSLGVGILGSTFVLQRLSGGWFTTYLLDLPSRHQPVDRVWVTFWTLDLLRPLAIAVAAAAVVLWRRRHSPEGRWFLAPVVAGLVLTAYSSRLHSGGYDNVLLPAYGAVALLFGIALADVVEWRPPKGWWQTAALVALGAQLVLLAYDPRAQLPTPRDRRAGHELLAALRGLDGTIYLPGHGWYLARTGHPPVAQSAAVSDVLRVPGAPGRTQLVRELRRAVDQELFDYVIVDSTRRYSYLPRDFDEHYRRARRLDHLVRPVTGTRTAPASIWVPIG